MFCKCPVSFCFYQPLTQTWQGARIQGCGFCGGALHSACYPRKPRGGSIELETTAPTIRQIFCCNNCRRRTTPEAVRFLGRRVYPGLVMILLSAMQSGVTDNLINELRLSLGVARRTLRRWRHWWREIFVETPFWNYGSGRFMPPIEHSGIPLTDLLYDPSVALFEPFATSTVTR